jgi:hypothetical protein
MPNGLVERTAGKISSGESLSKIAKDEGIPKSTLRFWLKKAKYDYQRVLHERDDLTGKRFACWTVLERRPSRGENGQRRPYWLCRCVCGIKREVAGASLRNGISKSCGCSRLTAKLAAHLTWLHGHVRKPQAARNRVRGIYRRSAEKRGLLFLLDDAEFDRLILHPCYYCGEPPSNEIKPYGFRYSGIDRVDSEKGYVSDNCVPCCRVCNDMKGVMSFQAFAAQAQKIAKFKETHGGME